LSPDRPEGDSSASGVQLPKEGTMDEVQSDPHVIEVYLGRPDGRTIAFVTPKIRFWNLGYKLTLMLRTKTGS